MTSPRPGRPLLSAVAPVFNEAECLPAFHARLRAALAAVCDDYEIVYIDDGSSDGSLELIRQFSDADPRVAYQSFSRNFGHEAATTAGLQAASGEAVVLIDSDLQDPPELIGDLVARWRLGWQVVVAQRRRRAGESLLVRATSALFYRLLQRFADGGQVVDAGDFRLLDRQVVDAVNQLPEHHRYVRGLTHWVGFRQTTVTFDRDARAGGCGKYSFFRRLNLALDAFCSLSLAPLRGVLWLGVLLSATALCAGCGLALATIAGVRVAPLAWLGCGGALVAGLQVAALGIVAEYLARVHANVQGRPLYIVAEERSASRAAAAGALEAAG